MPTHRAEYLDAMYTDGTKDDERHHPHGAVHDMEMYPPKGQPHSWSQDNVHHHPHGAVSDRELHLPEGQPPSRSEDDVRHHPHGTVSDRELHLPEGQPHSWSEDDMRRHPHDIHDREPHPPEGQQVASSAQADSMIPQTSFQDADNSTWSKWLHRLPSAAHSTGLPAGRVFDPSGYDDKHRSASEPLPYDSVSRTRGGVHNGVRAKSGLALKSQIVFSESVQHSALDNDTVASTKSLRERFGVKSTGEQIASPKTAVPEGTWANWFASSPDASSAPLNPDSLWPITAGQDTDGEEAPALNFDSALEPLDNSREAVMVTAETGSDVQYVL
jgi:hypothetical protein